MGTVETIKNLLTTWGAGWVLWLLFALSIGSVAVVIERWLFFRRKEVDVRALAVERKELQDRLAFLGTLGNNVPFIGLFGTVIGVILAFESLGQQAGTGGMASVGVMSAVSEALVATVVGIGVALPAVAAHNYFQRRIAVLLEEAETLSNLTLAYLTDEDAPATGEASTSTDRED